MYSDPFGLMPCPPCAEALAVAGGVAAIDGPLPVGDVVGAGIALGVGFLVVADAASGVYHSIRNKVHDSRLRGEVGNIAEHFGKLGNPNQPGGNDPRNRQKWKDDIQNGINRMKGRIDKLKGAIKDRWQETVKRVEDRLRDTQ